MWNEEVDMEYVWSSNIIVYCVIKDEVGRPLWNLLACYGPPYLKEKSNF